MDANPDPSIACALDPSDLAARRADLLPGLFSRAESVSQIPGGYEAVFPAAPDTLRAITEVIDAERQCCRFLTFTVTVPAEGGDIVVAVTGPKGTQDFLGDLLAR